MKVSEHSYGMGFSQTNEINWHRIGKGEGKSIYHGSVLLAKSSYYLAIGKREKHFYHHQIE